MEKLHGNKKIRVNSSLDQDTHDKLQKLAISCNMTKTQLAYELIKFGVNHTSVIKYFQDVHNTNEQYRVIPAKHGDKIIY